MKRSKVSVRRPLSDTTLEALEAESKEYRLHNQDGVYFRVKPNGKKSWQLRYKKPNGKWTFAGLGNYPSTSWRGAKEQAEKMRARVEAGEPIRAKRDAERIERESTFQALATEWLDNQRSWTEGTRNRHIGSLNKHVLPAFGARRYADITPMEWLDLLQGMERQGIIEQASRVRAACRAIYDLALLTDRATFNPLERLHTQLTSRQTRNYAYVPIDELPQLLRAIATYPHAADVRLGLFILSRLAVRPSELRCATWDEIDLDKAEWQIPAERMKRRRDHVVPLSRQVVDALLQLHQLTGHQPLLFPGRSDQTKPRSDTVFVMALRRMGYANRQTGHGFRHQASTILNEQGYNSDWIEAQLSHTKSDVRHVYNKAKYLPQRREMMQWYADHLDRMETGDSALQVGDE